MEVREVHDTHTLHCECDYQYPYKPIEHLTPNQATEPEAMLEARQEAVPSEAALVDCVKFCVVGQKQPYTVYISSNSLLLMDYHCHLSTEEVCG